MLNAGHETTTNLIGNALVCLHEWPQEKARLLERLADARGDAAREEAILGAAVDEFLRFESSNQLGNRRALRETEVGGVRLPTGALVTLCIGAANRDPTVFADPERLDLTRTDNRHLAVGFGVHQCAGLMFWLVGFGLMFGPSVGGWIGSGLFGLLDQLPAEPRLLGFVLFQVMFCATAATIVSGAVAERIRFSAYIALSVWISLVVYPVFGHWAWGGAWEPGARGWLAELGFVDFAGSTVVHSVGGWVALVVVVVVRRLGARTGRFPADGPPPVIPAGNLPMAMLGALLLFFGWLGFNGGSTLAFDGRVPGILLHTTLAACAGGLAGLAVGRLLHGYYEVLYLINGLIAGLVAVTAGAHALSPLNSLLTGAVGAWVMAWTNEALLRWRIDDAVGAIPAHLAAGVWDTLAVGLFGDPVLLGTGLPRWE